MRPAQKESPRTVATVQGAGSLGTTKDNNTTRIDPAANLIARLDGIRETGAGQWIARCPAHDDRSPSLSIKQVDDRVLIHCFAGCEVGDVMASIGLTLADLYDRPLAHHKAPLSAYQRHRHGQAAEAIRAVQDEMGVIAVLTEQVVSGFALDPAELERLKLAMQRVENARRLAA